MDINKLRDELAHEFVNDCPKYSGYPEHYITYTAGFDKRGEIDREEIERLNNAYESMAGAARRLEKMWEEQRANEEKFKRVIEIQRMGLVDVMDVDDRNESVTWDIADSALAEADAILNGEKE